MNSGLIIGNICLYKGEVVKILSVHGGHMSTVQSITSNLSWYALNENLFQLSPVLKEIYDN